YWAASDDPYAADAIQWLIWDRDGCILLGDPGAGLGALAHLLKIRSEPALHVPFLIDGVEHLTPKDVLLPEGIHSVTAPPSLVIDGVTYTFIKWEDGSTALTRSIDLTIDVQVVSYYEGSGATPLTLKLTPGSHLISVPEVIVI
ncbi:unnamed protein product, partial [marine sediment metagenome]